MTVVSKPKRTKKTGKRRLLDFLLFLACLHLILLGIGKIDLKWAVAETDALDPIWRFEDLDAARPQVPDADNSAVVIAAGNGLIDPKATKLYELIDWDAIKFQSPADPLDTEMLA